MIRTGRPLRALAGLGLGVSVWIGVRLPAMQREMVALAALAAPPEMMAQAPPLAQSVPPPVAAPRPARVVLAAVDRRLPRALRPEISVVSETPAVAHAPPAVVTNAPPIGSITPQIGNSPGPDPAFALAAQAYDHLRTGQRRQAAALFDAALKLQPANRQWRADRQTLGRRWQAGGFALLRDGGTLPNAPGSGLPGFAASPVLGGGQVGASIAWLANPYARRPLALVVRTNVAADLAGVRGETAQLAVGLRQNLLPGVSVSVERLVPLGDNTRGAFTVRLAAGGRLPQLGQRLDAYGEAGVIDSGQIFAGGQARARLIRIGPATLHAGTWASVQTGSPDVWRIDVGPTVSMQIKGIRLEADWRQKVGGNASPGSGPVLTVSSGF